MILLAAAWATCVTDLPSAPDAALETLQTCEISPEWRAALRKRALGMRGLEEVRCPKAVKLFGKLELMDKVRKKCRVGWEVTEADGPRSLVVGWELVAELERIGIPHEDAERAGRIVAGMHGRGVRFGGWRDRRQQLVRSAYGMPAERPAFLAADAPASDLLALDRPLAVLPKGELVEDTRLLALPYTVREQVDAAVRIRGKTVTFGLVGDEHDFDSAAAAVRAVRHWLDWSQEFGREVLPDRVWLQPSGDVASMVPILSACLNEGFGEVVLAEQGTLLAWPAQADAIGLVH